MTCPIHTLRRHPSTCRLCPKEDGPGVPPLATQEVVRKKLEAMAPTATQMDFFEAPEPPPAPPKKVSAEPPKRNWYKDWRRVEQPQRRANRGASKSMTAPTDAKTRTGA